LQLEEGLSDFNNFWTNISDSHKMTIQLKYNIKHYKKLKSRTVTDKIKKLCTKSNCTFS